MRQHNILPAESQYSARRIWIFCQQNQTNHEQLHWTQKACTPWAELDMRQHNILLAESSYKPKSAGVYKDIYRYNIVDSNIFCRQNIQNMLAGFGFSAGRLKRTKKQLHSANKASTPRAELGTAQPPPFFETFPKSSPLNRLLRPNFDTTQVLLAEYQDSENI